jgi:hypothetical protein
MYDTMKVMFRNDDKMIFASSLLFIAVALISDKMIDLYALIK